ncbi:MAG: hypothetical protein AAFY41_02115 [Bacteroidota bacterium]
MIKIFATLTLILALDAVFAQDYTDDLQDCNAEKDEVFIDWNNEINLQYAEKNGVKKFSKKRLRSFYCQNLIAKERLETDGFVQSKGGFQLTGSDNKYLVFSIEMGDIVYHEKLYIHISPRQKLASSTAVE